MRLIKLQHINNLLLTLLCAAGFSSCIRTDIGNTIGSIGKEVPKAVPAADYYQEIDCFSIRVVAYTAKVYEDDTHYYIDLPLALVPERRCGLEYVPQFLGEPIVEVCGGVSPGRKTLNEPYSTKELQNSTPHRCFVVIAKDNAEELVKPREYSTELSAKNIEAVHTISAAEFSTKKIRHVGIRHIPQAEQFAAMLPAKRAWYNYPLIPLQYAAMVGLDLPLSLVSMPLSLPYVICDPLIYYVDRTLPE